MRIYARNTMRAQLPLSPERKMLYALMNQASMYPGDMQLTEMLDNALRKAVSYCRNTGNLIADLKMLWN